MLPEECSSFEDALALFDEALYYVGKSHPGESRIRREINIAQALYKDWVTRGGPGVRPASIGEFKLAEDARWNTYWDYLGKKIRGWWD